MNRTIEDIYQNEIHPALYVKRAESSRRRNIEEIVGGVILVALVVVAFAVAQIAYGIW